MPGPDPIPVEVIRRADEPGQVRRGLRSRLRLLAPVVLLVPGAALIVDHFASNDRKIVGSTPRITADEEVPPDPRRLAAVPVTAGSASTTCRLELTKESEPETVRAGAEFVWVTTVANRSPCTFAHVSVSDFVTTTPGFKYWVLAEDPPATRVVALHSFSLEGLYSNVTWDDIGPLGPGQIEQVRIRVRSAAKPSVAGRFTSEATASAVRPEMAAADPQEVRISFDLPRVVPATAGRPPG